MFRLFVLLAAMIWGAIAHAEPVFPALIAAPRKRTIRVARLHKWRDAKQKPRRSLPGGGACGWMVRGEAETSVSSQGPARRLCLTELGDPIL